MYLYIYTNIYIHIAIPKQMPQSKSTFKMMKIHFSIYSGIVTYL